MPFGVLNISVSPSGENALSWKYSVDPPGIVGQPDDAMAGLRVDPVRRRRLRGTWTIVPTARDPSAAAKKRMRGNGSVFAAHGLSAGALAKVDSRLAARGYFFPTGEALTYSNLRTSRPRAHP